MKVTRKQQIRTTFEASEEDVEMTLDESSSAMLMSSLTYLYGTPVLAALREYTANAMDETENLEQNPVEINFPVPFMGKPCLRVKDHGAGMSEETLKETYSKYGASTRRSNNSKRGGFGLGSKSGLAVSDHFYIRTVSDGIQVQAIILKDTKTNTSYLRIEETKPTNVGPGTEIFIPVTASQLESLKVEAATELSGYHPDTYLLNGFKNESTVHNTKHWLPVGLPGEEPAGWFRFNDTTESILKPNLDEDFRRKIGVVMGGVFYPELPKLSSVNITTEMTELFESMKTVLSNTDRVVLNVPIGSVSLPPHRDALIDDPVTWQTLIAVLQNFMDVFPACIQTYADNFDYKEALKVIGDHPSLLTHVELEFPKSGRRTVRENISYKHRGVTYSAETKDTVIFSAHTTPWRHGMIVSNDVTAASLIQLAGRHPLPAESNYTNFINSVRYSNGTRGRVPTFHSVMVTDIPGFNELYTTTPQKARTRAQSVISSYVNKYLVAVYGAGKVPWTVVYLTESAPAPHFAALVDESFTLEQLQTKVRENRTTQPRAAITQIHGALNTEGVLSRYEVKSHDVIATFGGKGSLRTTQRYRTAVPDTALGSDLKDYFNRPSRLTGYPMLAAGLQMVAGSTSLVAVDVNRSYSKFLKDFPDATSLYETVVRYYNQLDEDSKELVYQAYTLHRLWGKPEPLMVYLSSQPVTHPVFRNLIDKPDLYALGSMFATFVDPVKENSMFNILGDRMRERCEKDKTCVGFIGLPVYVMFGKPLQRTAPPHMTGSWFSDNLSHFINTLKSPGKE